MHSNEEQSLIVKLLAPFSDSVIRLLKENLDEDVCKKISFEYQSSAETSDAEQFKENNVIYQTDFATGQDQGSLTLLIPEELIAIVADILTGGNGKKKSKGNLSELEINSTTTLLNKIVKDIENAFKHSYSQDLAFSSRPVFLTKEMPDFTINTNSKPFDYVVNYNLTLSEEISYEIKIILNAENSNKIAQDLGLSKANTSIKKISDSALDINLISDVKINITAELGRTRVPIKYALELIRGSLIELDTVNNSDIKVYANDIEFAYAQIVAIEDNFALKITKIISPKERLECIS